MSFQEAAVIHGAETYAQAVALGSRFQESACGSYFAYLVFGQPAHGQAHPFQYGLGKPPQEKRLVLVGILSASDVPVAVDVPFVDIMPCGQVVNAPFVGHLRQ